MRHPQIWHKKSSIFTAEISLSPRMPIPFPSLVMTTRATTPYRLQHRIS